jgi:putative hydrolases of HD superfamily
MESAESRGPLGGQIRFLREADELKGVLRQSSILDGSRKENSAEHSWHLALMAQVLGDYAPRGTDLSRVTGMLLIHDLVEIDAGDLFVYADATAQAHQEAAEHAAADRIFALLPPGQGRGLRALWDEFEERRTPEARFARALDRLQPMLANYYLGGGTWQAYGVRAGQVLDKAALIADGSPALGVFARELVDSAVRQGFLSPGE